MFAKDLMAYFKLGGSRENLDFNHVYEVLMKGIEVHEEKNIQEEKKRDIQIPIELLKNTEVRNNARV